MSEISVFDERLAEIDRRLRTIQSDLTRLPDPPPDSPADDTPADELSAAASRAGVSPAAASRAGVSPVPPPPARLRAAPDPAPPPEPTATLIAELRELHAANARLLELHRELLSEYAGLLQRLLGDRGAVTRLS